MRMKEIMHVKHVALAFLRALKWKLVKCQLGVGDGQGSLACCSPWGCRVRRDWVTELNWKLLSRVWLFVTPWNPMEPHGLYSAWNSPGQSTGVGSLSLLQGIFPTQGLNPGLPHCRRILYRLSHHGSPGILEWAAYPVSRGSSRPRNLTGVSGIAGGFFTNWTTREAQGF